jgi:hypothetical protein
MCCPSFVLHVSIPYTTMNFALLFPGRAAKPSDNALNLLPALPVENDQAPAQTLTSTLAPVEADEEDIASDDDDDGNSSSDDSYLSYFDDSDDDEHVEESQAAKDQREQARNAVLQAAGLSVRRPPPGVPGPKKPRRRAPPQPPISDGPSKSPASTADIPPTPPPRPDDRDVDPVSGGPDAYDRYEAYLAKAADVASRARSQSDARPASLAPSSPGPGSAVRASPSGSSSGVPLSAGSQGRLAGFVNRISASTSQSTADKRPTPAISGPVSIVRVEEGQSSEEPSGPTTWSSLVDPELLKNISPQERKHQEVCFLIASIPEVSADRNGALRPYSSSSLPREPVSCRSGRFRSYS